MNWNLIKKYLAPNNTFRIDKAGLVQVCTGSSVPTMMRTLLFCREWKPWVYRGMASWSSPELTLLVASKAQFLPLVSTRTFMMFNLVKGLLVLEVEPEAFSPFRWVEFSRDKNSQTMISFAMASVHQGPSGEEGKGPCLLGSHSNFSGL